MIIILQYPLADVRAFVGSKQETGMLSLPNWPSPQSNQFVRYAGQISRRKKGGLDAIGEYSHCECSQSFKFHKSLSIKLSGDQKNTICDLRFARFYFDGFGMAKYELGIIPRIKSDYQEDQTTLQSLIDSLMDNVVSIRTTNKKDRINCKLQDLTRHLPDHYLCATTNQDWLANNSPQKWWVTSCTPLIFLENITNPESHIVNNFYSKNVPMGEYDELISHAWIKLPNNQEARLWFYQDCYIDDKAYLRDLRLLLMRFHADQEVFSSILTLLSEDKISPTFNSVESNLLQEFILNITRRISRQSTSASRRSDEILDVARESINFVDPGYTQGVLDNLKMHINVRPNVFSRVIEYLTIQELNLTGQPVIMNNTTNTTNTTNITGDNNVVDNKTIIAHKSTISDETSQKIKIINSTIDDVSKQDNVNEELINLIKELSVSVEKAALSDEVKSKDLIKDLGLLTEEIEREKPRQKWYKITTDGLVEAANSMGKIGEPILEIVSKILPLLV